MPDSRGWTCLTVANVVFAPFRPPSFTFGNILLPHTPNGVPFSLVQVQSWFKTKKGIHECECLIAGVGLEPTAFGL